MKKAKQQPAEPPTFPPYLTEIEQQRNDDYDWCLNHPELSVKYAGKVVVLHQRKVLAVGKHHMAAWAAAQRKRGCPPRHEVILVPLP